MKNFAVLVVAVVISIGQPIYWEEQGAPVDAVHHLYVDGVQVLPSLPGVACTFIGNLTYWLGDGTTLAPTFTCHAPLPIIGPGTHALVIASVNSAGTESYRSNELDITIAAPPTPSQPHNLRTTP